MAKHLAIIGKMLVNICPKKCSLLFIGLMFIFLEKKDKHVQLYHIYSNSTPYSNKPPELPRHPPPTLTCYIYEV